MPLSNISLAEEALCLPPDERAGLAKLMIDSLDSQTDGDEQIRANLSRRLKDLLTGSDAGLSFEQVFGKPL
jgi:putative addiction module component (TIGR02574 family)